MAQAEAAVSRAFEVFSQTRVMPSHERYTILRRIHDGILAQREEFARGIVDEAGKPIRDARGEVDRALLVFSLCADEARRIGGDVLPLDLNVASAGRLGLTRRFGRGPVAAITPFNFPLNLVAHKVGPAVAAGCPVVLKPAEKTPLTALRLAEVVAQSGWPEGGFAVLTPNDPKPIGEFLASDTRLPVLSFTGSDRVGWHLKSLANKKHVTLELGGNAAVVVEPDADLEYAAARCAWGAFANAGQVCISVQRIFVHQSVFDTFTGLLVEHARALKVGDPHDESTDIGPMISPSARNKAEQAIALATTQGATALLRGEASGLSFLSPTILTGVKAGMAVQDEEVFAPVVVVEPYDTLDKAFSRVNNSRFGLQAGIFTRDVRAIFQAHESLHVGAVIANDVPQFRVDNMPYGGEKESGFGREGVRYALQEMTEERLLVLHLA
jgi:acyl-CoA reductase-like NAD-dependent aldehyde dehydrogenase